MSTRLSPPPTPIPLTGAVESTCRGASAVASGDGVSATRTLVADTTGPVEDVVWGSNVNQHLF